MISSGIDHNVRVIPAVKADAPGIGWAVVEAVGHDLAFELSDGRGVVEVIEMFVKLASRADSQYSYINTLKAVDSGGNVMGYIVGYDGAQLHELRPAFFEEYSRFKGDRIHGDIHDETSPDEFYLDSVAVKPEYRGRGVARALICGMVRRSAVTGKPVGLLCAKDNSVARKIYTSLGFKQVGERFFAGELMDHLQCDPSQLIDRNC